MIGKHTLFSDRESPNNFQFCTHFNSPSAPWVTRCPINQLEFENPFLLIRQMWPHTTVWSSFQCLIRLRCVVCITLITSESFLVPLRSVNWTYVIPCNYVLEIVLSGCALIVHRLQVFNNSLWGKGLDRSPKLRYIHMFAVGFVCRFLLCFGLPLSLHVIYGRQWKTSQQTTFVAYLICITV